MKNRTSLLVTSVLAFALTACNAGEQASRDRTPLATTGSAADTKTPGAAQSCLAQDFDQFLTAFMGDVEVQKTHVALPLKSETVDPNAEPEPKPVTKMLPLADLKFPLMLSPQQQAQDGLQLSKTVTDPTHIEVKLVKPDTDYQLTFLFQNDGCWKLYQTRDDSL
ncbi:hypothetical protein SAMN05216570_0463 [Dyella sp. OK004]|uniref:hypothetical protein n=1 Tax=Dyella sp. OK004 TaxID=1855292 RepID=UPI0008DFFF88|nr:hypothetical protein [Dyella sp. OK004]SFR90168.1 hypothetical protein SAMN05216570_0463 [Dyella sp. OK004]